MTYPDGTTTTATREHWTPREFRKHSIGTVPYKKKLPEIRQPRKYPDSETRISLTRHKTDPQDALDVINGLAFAIL